MAKTMDKEFVTYEQALALKELGFEYEKFYNYTSPMTNLAPLKQQVFRWFRENYGLYQQIEVYRISEFKDDELFFDFKIIDNSDDTDFQYNNDLYSTYEEAENAAIDKLIELAKQQDNG
jgi:hypothetical protein